MNKGPRDQGAGPAGRVVRQPSGWHGTCSFLPCAPRRPKESVAMNAQAPSAEAPFREQHHPWSTPIRDLGLRIECTPLEPVIAEFLGELEAAGIRKVKPHFYLSTDWGVDEDTVGVGIPLYLARTDLIELHDEHDGFLE